MKGLRVSILFVLIILQLNASAFALTIVSPTEGQIVYQRDRLNIIVKPDAGEKWDEVLLDVFPMSYKLLTGDYRQEIEIPTNELGKIDFTILAYNKAGQKVKLVRHLFVKLPPNAVLQSISLSNEIMAIRKVPQVSNLVDVSKIETRQLGVAGVYSDGVSRQLASSAMGTTYTSSDEKVATVSPEGKVSAQGLGNAIITVRNGKYSATVKVVVKPYKK